MLGNLLTNEYLGSTDYDTKCQKIQFLLNKLEVLEHWSGYRSPKNNKDGTASEQYRQNKKPKRNKERHVAHVSVMAVEIRDHRLKIVLS